MDIAGLGDDDDGMVTLHPIPQRSTEAPVASHMIRDDDWDQYQEWKRQRAAAAAKANGDAPAAVARSNQPVGVPRTVKIVVEAVDNMPPSGHPVGINGQCYILKPGVPQRVPYPILEILRNAKIGVSKRDPLTMRHLRFEDRLRLPFTVLPDDDEAVAA